MEMKSTDNAKVQFTGIMTSPNPRALTYKLKIERRRVHLAFIIFAADKMMKYSAKIIPNIEFDPPMCII
jgi:hypothetical protein